MPVSLIIVGVLVGLAVLALGVNRPVRTMPATVADDPTLPTVNLDGVILHAETRGDPSNPVVVVVHGGPGGDYKNLLVLEALADDYYVVFYDQRGTGLSPRVPDDELSFDGSIEDLHRIVLHYGGGKPVAILGHSWGAMMAAYYATRHPRMVARAVLAEPGVLTDDELTEFIALMQPGLRLRTVWYLAGVMLQTLWVRGPDADARRDYFVEQMMHTPGEGNAMNRYWCGGKAPAAANDSWRVGTRAMQKIQRDSIQPDGSLRMPPLDPSAYAGELLFIASSCNSLIGVERQRSHVAMFPCARLEVIEDAGHLMFTDQAAASLATIRAYLAEWPDSAHEHDE